MIPTVNHDISVIKSSGYVSVRGNHLVKDKIGRMIARIFSDDSSTIKAVIDYALKRLGEVLHKSQTQNQSSRWKKDIAPISMSSVDNEKLKKALKLGNLIIKRYFDNKKAEKEVLKLDHALSAIRKGHICLIPENQKRLEKWLQLGFDKIIFFQFPEFIDFCFESKLIDQIRVTDDKILLIDNEPAILVEGRWTKFSALKERFEYKYSPKFKTMLICEKSTSDVYTYLDTKQGLVKHHPYLFDELVPVSRLNNKDYKTALMLGKKFPRKIKGRADYIIQIVSSEKKQKGVLKDSNLFNTFVTPQHPYFRIIDPDRNVYCVGYWGWVDPKTFLAPLLTDNGNFRSPDIFEYRQVDKKYVTNFAATKKEIDKIRLFCRKYQNGSKNIGTDLVFNFMEQNCTSFIRTAMEYATGIKIPSQSLLKEVIAMITPLIFQQIGEFFQKIIKDLRKAIFSLVPKCLKKNVLLIDSKIRELWEAFINSTIFSPLLLFLGGLKGKLGRKFGDPNKNQEMGSLLTGSHWWSTRKFDLPSNVQKWQKTLASTAVFENPNKLAIA